MGDKDMQFTEVAEDVLSFLREYHVDEQNAVKSGVICELFSIHKERVRAVVNYLRSTGYPVCSSSRGYWYSWKPEDIKKTLSHLEGRISGMQRAISGLKSIEAEK